MRDFTYFFGLVICLILYIVSCFFLIDNGGWLCLLSMIGYAVFAFIISSVWYFEWDLEFIDWWENSELYARREFRRKNDNRY